jgi:hypothetical protein
MGPKMIQFYSIPPTSSSTPKSHPSITRLLLSPNENYVAFLSGDQRIQIHDTASGKELMSSVLPEIEDLATLRMKFSSNSSIVILWTQTFIYIMDIERLLINTVSVKNLVGVAFLNSASPPSILMIKLDGKIHLHSSGGISQDPVCHISIDLSRDHMLVVSPDDTTLAIQQPGLLVVREMFKDSRDIHWAGACVDATFTPDSKFLIILENFNFLTTVSLLKLPSFEVCYNWSPSYRFVSFDPSEPDRAFGQPEDRWTRYSRVTSALESHRSNEVILEELHKERGWVHHCENYLLNYIWHSRQGHYLQFNGSKVAWLTDSEVFVADMSLFFEYSYAPLSLLIRIS